MPATLTTPLEGARLSDKNESHVITTWLYLIGQIKLTRIHVALLSLPGVRVKQAASHLLTMSKNPAGAPRGANQPNFALIKATLVFSQEFYRREVVEPIGIEPTT
jgi:hypothetical protein